jgi:hypothetical protein
MWFTETPWPPIVILSVIAAVCYGLWHTGGRSIFFSVAVGCLLLAVGVYVGEKMIVTDAEKVEALVYELADAVEADDAEKALAHISHNAEAERGLVKTGIDLIDVEGNLRITDLQVELFSENSRARSHFRANGTERLAPTGGQSIDPMAKRVE